MKTLTNRYSIVSALLVLATVPVMAATTVFFDDFNSYTPGLANDDASFTTLYTVPSTGVTIDAGTGLSGSQALDFSGDRTMVRKTPVIDLVNNGGIGTVSLYFQYPGAGGTSGPQIGFVVAPNGGVTGGGDLSGRLSNNKLELRKNNSQVSVAASALTLTTSNWYQIVFEAERTSTADTFDLSVTVFNSDSAGVVGSIVGTLAASTTDATLYADTSLYGVIRENTAITAMDNFLVTQASAVPEPQVFAAALGLIAIGVAGVRRRR